MEKRLKFCIILNANASGGRKLKLINKVIDLLKVDHDIELFKTISEEAAKEIFKDNFFFHIRQIIEYEFS